MKFANDTTDFSESRNVNIGDVRAAGGAADAPAVLSMNANFNL